MNLSTTIKSIQDIMRKDAGVDGDAQRISQLGWMLFLKIFDDREKEYEAMNDDARWEFWKSQLDKCIRCYACRKACPMCYCDPCFIDQLKPKWADKAPQSPGNIMYHLTRFHHLAGRCIDCGECSRACPVDIPLYLFHKKVAKECEEMFKQASGMSIEDKPVLVNFRVEDSDKILE